MREGLGGWGGSGMAGTAKRVNISLPEEVHSLLQQLAGEYYGGNLSRFLGDAGVFYAGVLAERRRAERDKPRD